ARQGFDGPIQLSVPGELPGVVASGGLVAAGAAEGTLILTADAGADPRPIDLEIWGQGGNPAQPLRRRARLATDGTPLAAARPMAIPAAIGPGPPATLAASATSLTFVHGAKAELVVKANRAPGHKEPIDLTTAGLPPLVTGGTATIAGDRSEATLTF